MPAAGEPHLESGKAGTPEAGELLASLESDQFVAAKARYRRRHLSPGLRTLFWALRIYVLAMAAVILYVLWHH